MRLPNGTDARYFLSPDSILSVENGVAVAAGDVLARIPREGSKTRDITGGLPRVAELFEARRPKDHAIIAEIDGRVEFGKDYKAKRRIIVKNDETGEETEYLIPKGKHVSVQEGDFVRRGDPLVDGPRVPHDILKVLGVEALSDYLVNEIQDVYRLQGVKINDKHIEVIVRQMLQKVEILEPGDTTYLAGEQIDRMEFEAENNKRIAAGERVGDRDAGAAGHHQGQPADPQLHQRRLVPGDHAGADRGGNRRQGRYPDGPEGERDRRPPDPGRHRRGDEPSAFAGRREGPAARHSSGHSGDHRARRRGRVASPPPSILPPASAPTRWLAVLYRGHHTAQFMGAPMSAHYRLRRLRRMPLASPRQWMRRVVFWIGAVLVAAAAIGFAALADQGSALFVRFQAPRPWVAFLICPLGLVASYLLTRHVFPGAQGSGIPQVIASQHMTDREAIGRVLSLRVAAGKFVLTLLGLCCGASIGREGPTVQIGAAIMHALGRAVRLPHLNLERALMLAGGAAGVAAAFNTPLAGIVFAIEELSPSFEARTSGTVLTAVIIAGITTLALMGNYTYFGHTSAELDLGRGWLAVLLCGVGGGLSGGIFSAALVRAAYGFPGRAGRLISANPVVFVAVCGLALAAIGVATGGKTYGTGYAEGTRHGRGHCAARRRVRGGEVRGHSYFLHQRHPRRHLRAIAIDRCRSWRLAGAIHAVGAVGCRGTAWNGGLFFRRGAGSDHRNRDRLGDDRQPASNDPAAGHGFSRVRYVAAGMPPADLWRAGKTVLAIPRFRSSRLSG